VRVFLDVGAHVGETLKPALDSRYQFDRIVCFEPVQSCCAILEKLADWRVEICRFGLWNETSRRPIYGAGAIGATLFGNPEQSGQAEFVDLRKASDWFQEHMSDDDEVYLKLNCEGSECDILDDLLDSEEIGKVTSILVDFDVRKVPSLAHREPEVRERLEGAGYSNVLCLKERYKGPTHTATVENWLQFAGARPLPPPAGWKWRYVWFPALVRKTVAFGKGLVRRVLPKAVYKRLRVGVQKIVYGYPPDANLIVIVLPLVLGGALSRV
jgi:FkbM family methyltransferase